MRIFLAPMEGVVDANMRKLLSAIGGVDVCVTEFIRVTDHILPNKVFYRRCPELKHQSLTASGTPVRVQLLGGKPDPVAANGRQAALLGASAIDLNFGCPAKTVNRNDGGACLLKEPERLNDIVAATRQQVPTSTPVTAKIRLGFDDRSRYLENALAAYEGGANELTVHARSKADGYRPPAYWDYITDIRENIPIPVIANGEIWSLSDFQRCRSITGCTDFMIGRGLLSFPDLARQIKAKEEDRTIEAMQWPELQVLLLHFFESTADAYPAKYIGNRLKQWLHYLCRQYPEAKVLFEQIKRCRDRDTITHALQQHTQESQKSESSLALSA
ncbi:MAG: tRNA dihydrouridine synthase [Cellvibrionaceae bacterium]